MPNMNYCRFENTLSDLTECVDALESGEFEKLSQDEKDAASNLADICADYIGVYDAAYNKAEGVFGSDTKGDKEKFE